MKHLYLVLIITLMITSCESTFDGTGSETDTSSIINEGYFKIGYIESFHPEINKLGLREFPQEVELVRQQLMEDIEFQERSIRLSEIYGFPAWQLAQTYNTEGGDHVVIIPLLSPSYNVIQGYIRGVVLSDYRKRQRIVN